jgi:hypothetical protein
LEAALAAFPPVLSAEALKKDLQIQLHKDISFDDEDSLLGHLKYSLTQALSGEWRYRCEFGIPAAFSPDGYVVNVMTRKDYDAYYKSPSITGHDYDRPLSRTINGFRPTARTREYFWAAPRKACPEDCAPELAAETLRNLLGLVHYGGGVPLMALYIKVPDRQACFRPSVIEANPNARFRQVHPDRSESQWGYTVDLSRLPTAPVGQTIAGAPEILVGQVALAESPDVMFVSLGVTTTDKDTASSDRAFRDHLRASRAFEEIYRQIATYLEFDI